MINNQSSKIFQSKFFDINLIYICFSRTLMDHLLKRSPRSILWEELSDFKSPDFMSEWTNITKHWRQFCQINFGSVKKIPRSATDDEVEEEDWLKVIVGGERHFREETIANWKNKCMELVNNWLSYFTILKSFFIYLCTWSRYSVTMAPLKEGSFHSRRAVVGDLNKN